MSLLLVVAVRFSRSRASRRPGWRCRCRAADRRRGARPPRWKRARPSPPGRERSARRQRRGRAAFCGEAAFRGYLLTRLTDVLGHGPSTGLSRGDRVLGPVRVAPHRARSRRGHRERPGRHRVQRAPLPVPHPVGTCARGFDDTLGFTWFFFFGPFYGLG